MDIGKLKDKKKNKERLRELEKKLKAIEDQKLARRKNPEVSQEKGGLSQESSSQTEIQGMRSDFTLLKESVEKSATVLEERIIAKLMDSLSQLLEAKIQQVEADISRRYESVNESLQSIQATLDMTRDQLSTQLREVRRDQVCRVEFDQTSSQLEALSNRILRSINESNEILEIISQIATSPMLQEPEKEVRSVDAAQPKIREQELIDILGVISKFQGTKGSDVRRD
ncbi:MAG: hypothetical protein ABI361_01435 [Nitrososphaera sp.]